MNEPAELCCPTCQHTAVCGPAEMIHYLRGAQMVRRDVQPEPDVLGELFRSSAAKFVCPECGATGLIVRRLEVGDDEAWGIARRCVGCGRPIDRQRLAVLPDARLCAACQAADERGERGGPAEYCAKCGGEMVVCPRHGPGVTRYQLWCPACRR